MTVKEAIEKRKSIRKYQDKEISMDILNEVLEAGRLAPSARNLQDWKFIAVTDKALRPDMLRACNNQAFMAEAPASIVVCATKTGMMSCNQDKSSIDCSIALSFMMLRAVELDLGTVWLGSFSAEEVKKVLNLPEEYIPVAVTPIGYPAHEGNERKRKTFDEVVSFNKM